MQNIYLENTPDLIKTDENNNEYIDIKRHVCGKNILGRLYRDKVVVIKGSDILSIRTSVDEILVRKIEKFRQGNIEKVDDGNYKLLKDMTFKTPSCAMQFAYGANENGWRCWVNMRGIAIDTYRYKHMESSTKPLHSQEEHKKYKLKEEFSSRGDESVYLIGCKIDFDNDIVGIIVSDTEMRIDNNTADIGEYIDKNNIDINLVTIGAYWFTEVYEEA